MSLIENSIRSEEILLPILNDLKSSFKFKLYRNYEIVKNGDAKKEIDFILNFEEFKLILIIEAKGGRLDYVGGEWKNTKTGIAQKDPFNQARDQKRKLEAILGLKENEEKKSIQYLVWFTDSKINCPKGNENNYLDSSCINNKKSALVNHINTIIKSLNKVSDNTFYSRINEILLHSTTFDSSLIKILDSNQREIEENTKSLINKNLTSAFLRNNYVLVSGTAGTGKSYYANYLANYFSDNGYKVLYLCYNIINGKLINHKSNKKFHANDLLSFYSTFSIDTTLPNNIKSKNDINKYYKETLPNKLIDIFKKIKDEEKYDVVIVDEGQDFNKNQLQSLFKIAKKQSKFFIFRDNFQKLYEKNLYDNLLNSFFHIEFLINYRNPTKIFERVKKEFEFIQKAEVEPCFNQIEGKNKNITFNNIESLKIKLNEEIGKLINENVTPGNIWILVGDNFKDNFSFLEDYKITDEISIKYIDNQLINFDVSNVINLTRPSLIKGLEFPIVMIIDSDNWVSKYDSPNIKHHVYTAITRCTDRLYNFVFKKEEITENS